MKINYLHKRTFGLIGLIVVGPLFLFLTNPSGLPLPFVILPFLWLFGLIFYISYLLLRYRIGIPKRRRVVISGVIAGLPVLLLVFDSIHQLALKDILLVVSLLAVASFYLLKADFID